MMRKELIATFTILTAGIALAGDSVSPAFTFDARYERSGQFIADFTTTEAVALTDRFSLRTVALVVDANGNGIPDAWEALYGLSGESTLADADPDGDGVCNLDEYNAGTNPVVAEDFSLAAAVSESHVVDTWYESSGLGFPELIEVFAHSGRFTADTVGRAPDTTRTACLTGGSGFSGLIRSSMTRLRIRTATGGQILRNTTRGRIRQWRKTGLWRRR